MRILCSLCVNVWHNEAKSINKDGLCIILLWKHYINLNLVRCKTISDRISNWNVQVSRKLQILVWKVSYNIDISILNSIIQLFEDVFIIIIIEMLLLSQIWLSKLFLASMAWNDETNKQYLIHNSKMIINKSKLKIIGWQMIAMDVKLIECGNKIFRVDGIWIRDFTLALENALNCVIFEWIQ